MDKAGLLRSIATTGYNVGFGAKKHFATFDIVEKVPGWIGFISSAVGIFALVWEPLSAKLPSACLAVLGLCTIYINPYKAKKYDEAGRKLTQIYNQLRDLYHSVQAGNDVQDSHKELKRLETEFYAVSISKQILFSDWYAHYKFFAQQERDWINEQRSFTWKDTLPLSFRIAVPLFVVACLGLIAFPLLHG
ncbi:SLATT domain-containing protein [Methylobacterium aquaticum]|uniref:SLATT domain-containing protein n=1 Tax=Methylobacterium aquaticum TaxID=270351 RepID=UPI001931E4FA|nr:SLATT domain-containing protein [Methylobacterium aquaticum]QRE76986.1 SLATT domain-containing protein [Methylobacterium aquaticum]